MIITTILIAAVADQRWGWSRLRIAIIATPLIIIDLAFVIANLFKIPAGGWIPLMIGGVGFTIFTTWNTGRRLLTDQVAKKALTVDRFLEGLAKNPPMRHPGTGVYLYRTPDRVPPALLANIRHNDSLHETVVFLSVVIDNRAHVNLAERDRVKHYDMGFHTLEMHYGFTDETDLAADLRQLVIAGLTFDPNQTTYFLGRERISVTDRPGMMEWRERLFAFMFRNAGDPATYFDLPPDRSLDIGSHVDI
jgi:KUP system potassium uptake protein